MNKQKIIPHLWFNKEAGEAADFYVSIFPDSKIISKTELRDTPSGDTPIVDFELTGYQFMAISAGPLFTFNPSISFILNFDPSVDASAQANLDTLWGKLADGGKELMALKEYPFSKRYGWIQDKYGVSWQLMLTNPEGEKRPFITPSLMFVGDNCGKAEEAVRFYQSVFKGSRAGNTVRYPEGMDPDKPGTVMFADFMLENQWFAAMDSARMHDFTFSEAISFLVNCETQEEINEYWEKLSSVPEAEQCGWLKDRYGLSWQITPILMHEMMTNGTPEQIDRVTKAFLPMKKLDIATLEKAYDGKD